MLGSKVWRLLLRIMSTSVPTRRTTAVFPSVTRLSTKDCQPGSAKVRTSKSKGWTAAQMGLPSDAHLKVRTDSCSVSEMHSLGIPDRRDSKGSHSGFDQGMQNQGIVARVTTPRVVPHVGKYDWPGTSSCLSQLCQGEASWSYHAERISFHLVPGPTELLSREHCQ